MKKASVAAGFMVAFMIFIGCGKKEDTRISAPVDLAALAAAVPTTGPRTGNNYKVFFQVIRQNQEPAPGFKIAAWVKDKSEPVTVVTDASGLATFSLPYPDSRHRLNAVFHYYRNGKDQARDVDYPYIESDAYRLKDTQTIPNDATPEPTN